MGRITKYSDLTDEQKQAEREKARLRMAARRAAKKGQIDPNVEANKQAIKAELSQRLDVNTTTKLDIANSAEGYPLLGQVVYWSVSHFDVKYDAFVEYLKEAGIDVAMAKAPRAKSALIKAIKETTTGKDEFHRKVIDKTERATFALVDSKINEATEDVQFETETKVTLNKATKNLRVTGSRGQQIEDSYESFLTRYTGDQFRAIVLKYLTTDCDATTVRDQGGVYFVPSYKQSEFEKLQCLFDCFENCSLDVVPVIDTAIAKKSVWKSLVGEVEQDLAKLATELAELPEDASDRLIENRIERYRSLKEKVENYSDLFSGQADLLTDQLSDIKDALKKRLI